MADFNNYQSGGKGFVSPSKAVENATYREFMSQSGGKDGLAQKDQADVVNILHNILDQLARNTELSNEQMNEMKSALHDRVMSASNTQQGAREGTSLLNSLIGSNTELLRGLGQQKGLTGVERSTIGAVNNSALKQLVQLNQGILSTLRQLSGRIGASNDSFDRFHSDFIEIDASNDKQQEKFNQEQLGKFDMLQQIIAFGLASSPTARKLNQIGASLIGLGLMKVMGNEKVPEPLRKMAAGAIYLQIPQTLMSIIGMVVSQTLSKWLMNSASKLLGEGLIKGLVNPAKGLFSGGAQMFARLIPLLSNPFVLAGALLVGAVAATVAGVMAHKKKMKENDARLDADPTLSEDQREREKLKAHSASGARAGIAGGALGGAAIGAVVGSIVPGVGTAIGAVVGGLIGLIGGPLIGAIVGGWKHFGIIGKDIKNGIKGAVGAVGDKIQLSAKWASEHKEQIVSFLKPVAKVLMTLLELSSPFFILFRAFALAARKFFGDNGGPSNTVSDPGSSGPVSNLIESFNKGSLKYTTDKKGNAFLGGHLITSGYGERTHPTTGSKYDGKKHFHKGIDIAYNKNDSIGAFMGGQVVYAGNRNDGYGNTVEIKDKNGAIHKYHHGNSIPQAILDAYKTGGSVADGQEIMKAGATGIATGVHLDYEVWKNGSHTNPLQYLEQEAKARAEAEKAKKKAEEEKWRKEHPTQAAIKDGINLATKVINAGKKDKQDATGTKDFTNMQNSTNNLVNRGN